MFEGSSGLQLNGWSFTTVIFGNMSTKARTIVVFPEPFGPRMSTPPILGLMALIRMASFSLSMLTKAEKGKTVRFCILIRCSLCYL
jgi:hypothetical protein